MSLGMLDKKIDQTYNMPCAMQAHIHCTGIIIPPWQKRPSWTYESQWRINIYFLPLILLVSQCLKVWSNNLTVSVVAALLYIFLVLVKLLIRLYPIALLRLRVLTMVGFMSEAQETVYNYDRPEPPPQTKQPRWMSFSVIDVSVLN